MFLINLDILIPLLPRMAIFRADDFEDDDSLDAIQQRQFDKPPPNDLKKFRKWQKECDKIYHGDEFTWEDELRIGFTMSSSEEEAIPGTRITKNEFNTLVDWNTKGEEMTTNRSSIMDEYLRIVINHVNKERAEFKEMVALKEAEEKAEEEAKAALEKKKNVATRVVGGETRSRSRSPRDLRPRQPRVRSPLPLKKDKTIPNDAHPICKTTIDPKKDKIAPATAQPSCKMIRVERFEKIVQPAESGPPRLVPNLDIELTKILKEIDVDPANFRTLDYLFIPVHIGRAHMVSLKETIKSMLY